MLPALHPAVQPADDRRQSLCHRRQAVCQSSENPPSSETSNVGGRSGSVNDTPSCAVRLCAAAPQRGTVLRGFFYAQNEQPHANSYRTTSSEPRRLQNGLQFRNSKSATVFRKTFAKTQHF